MSASAFLVFGRWLFGSGRRTGQVLPAIVDEPAGPYLAEVYRTVEHLWVASFDSIGYVRELACGQDFRQTSEDVRFGLQSLLYLLHQFTEGMLAGTSDDQFFPLLRLCDRALLWENQGIRLAEALLAQFLLGKVQEEHDAIAQPGIDRGRVQQMSHGIGILFLLYRGEQGLQGGFRCILGVEAQVEPDTVALVVHFDRSRRGRLSHDSQRRNT